MSTEKTDGAYAAPVAPTQPDLRSDVLCDLSYRAGLKHGFNLGVEEDSAGLQKALDSRAEFEAWASVPPREFDLRVFNKNELWPGQYRMYETQCAWEGYQAGRASLAANAPTAAMRVSAHHPIEPLYTAPPAPTEQWVSVEERMPEPGEPVLLDIGKRVPIRAIWAAKHTVSAIDDDTGWSEYDEESDTYYCPEGWYEWNEHEEVHWRVDDMALNWQHLPAPPDTAAKGAK